MSDMYDYLGTPSPSWSLCKEHVQTIHTVIGDGRMGDKLRGEICVLLQDLVLVEDFIELLQNEPTKLINSVLLHFKELTDNVQMSLLKVVRLSLKKSFLYNVLTQCGSNLTIIIVSLVKTLKRYSLLGS